MRGAKPVPAELKRRRGTSRPDRDPAPVILAPRGAPDPPDYLDDAGRDFWSELCAALDEVGILQAVDRFALEAMATQWSRAIAARRRIDEDGLTSRGSQGQLVEHPAVKIERAALATVFRMLEHYGATPVARTRLGLAELKRAGLAVDLAGALGGGSRGPSSDGSA